MALNPDRELELLRDYEVVLREATARRDEAQQEVDSLEPIVEALRRRVGPVAQQDATPAPTYGGKPIMATVITEFFADGETKSADDVVRHFADHPAYADKQPSRASITNRLNDLTKAGAIERLSRGIYKLSAPDEEGS